ncbi:MAG: SET domain-containing protein [Planctomycetaceae bacterium]
MITSRLRTMATQYFPNLLNGRKALQADECKNLNETLVEIPLDHNRYSTTDEFSFVLKPSSLSGIGVFSTHGIAKGTRLALFPNLKTRFFSNKQIGRDPRLKSFCQVYGVETRNGSRVARNFCYMQVGWYLNHSEAPNAHHECYRYFASRDIDANEEITIDYRLLCK